MSCACNNPKRRVVDFEGLTAMAYRVLETPAGTAQGARAAEDYESALRTALSGLGVISTQGARTVADAAARGLRSQARAVGGGLDLSRVTQQDRNIVAGVLGVLGGITSTVLSQTGADPAVGRWITAVVSWVNYAITGEGAISLPPTSENDMRAFADFCATAPRVAGIVQPLMNTALLGALAAARAANNVGLANVLTTLQTGVSWIGPALTSVCRNPEILAYVEANRPAVQPVLSPFLTTPIMTTYIPSTSGGEVKKSDGTAMLVIPAALAAWFLLRK